MTSPLITGYVSGLRRGLPAALAKETAAGLLETYEHHLASGASLIILALDSTAVTAFLLAAPARTWILSLAATVSLGRIAFTARTLPRLAIR